MKYHLTHDMFWLRINGVGFVIRRDALMFSERYGYTKYLRLPFGWRANWLRR